MRNRPDEAVVLPWPDQVYLKYSFDADVTMRKSGRTPNIGLSRRSARSRIPFIRALTFSGLILFEFPHRLIDAGLKRDLLLVLAVFEIIVQETPFEIN